MSLRSEIFEQPEVARRLLEEGWPAVQRLAADLQRHTIEYIFLAARGSSDNAGRYAKYLFGIHNRLPTALAAPSLFSLYASPPRLANCLVLAISQSGQSPDIVGVVEEANHQGVPTVALTNDLSSPLATAAQSALDLCAGEEHAVAATKTYTAQLLLIAILSAALSDDPQQAAAIQRLPGWMATALDQAPAVNQAVASLADMERCVVIARGYNYATAFEWSLKLKELAGVIAEPYSSADFLHGPVALLEPGFPVLLLAPDGAVFNQLHQLAHDVLVPRKARVLALSNRSELDADVFQRIALPSDLPEWLSPLVGILPAQLFSAALAEGRGLDPERPRGLHKVTRTE